MKRRNIFLSILLIFTLLFALCSCHGAQQTPPETGGSSDGDTGGTEVRSDRFEIPEGLDMSREYHITFWGKNESNKQQTETYKAAVAEFERLYPNIHVTYKSYTDYGMIYRDVITNIPTGTTPNVCITYPDHIATYKTGEDVVVSLDSLISDPKYGLGGTELRFDGVGRDEIIGKFLSEGVIDGEQYALPYMRSTEACYVNVSLLEALGYELPDVLTWDFVFEVCEAAMKKGEDGKFLANGQTSLIPMIYKSTDNMMIQMLAQRGADYSTDGGDVLIFNDDTKDILFNISRYAALRAFSTFSISSYPGNSMNRGQCIFAIDSTAGATWMGTDAPNIDIPESELADFEIAVRPVPQYDIENPKMISQGPSICIFDKADPGEVVASWLFAQFLLTDEVQIEYAQSEGYVPVTTSAQSNPEYLHYLSRGGDNNRLYYKVKIDATKLLLDNIDNTFVTPVFNGSANLRNAAGRMIDEVASDARIGTLMSGAYMDSLFNRMISMYHLPAEGADLSEKPMPAEAIALIVTLAVIWVGIGGFVLFGLYKKRKKSPKP